MITCSVSFVRAAIIPRPLPRRRELGRVASDDIVDAAIAPRTAERFASGTARRIGDADLDAHNVRMEMWC